jgi:hypothetical protein
MNKALATIPTFTSADIANARAFAIANGNKLGNRGRVPMWALNEWRNALSPVLVREDTVKVPGARGRRSTVNVGGTAVEVTKAQSQHARMWAIENGIPVPTRGRLSGTVLQGWVSAGMPEHREEKATVYYRKLDKAGRPNGKEQIAIVYADMLGTGKPRMRDYWEALDIKGIPTRIIAGDMLINVTRDDDGALSYSWVSKRDSKAVVDTLLSNVSMA